MENSNKTIDGIGLIAGMIGITFASMGFMMFSVAFHLGVEEITTDYWGIFSVFLLGILSIMMVYSSVKRKEDG